jgi:hypothetical protein
MLPKTLDGWALTISILAIVLIVPLGILTIIITPKLQNRWATRSQSALLRQINELEKKLVRWETFAALTETEDTLFTGIQGAVVGVILILCVLMTMQLPPTAQASITPFQVLGSFVAVFGVFLTMFAFVYVEKFRLPRSEQARRSTRRQIESLKKKLEAKGSSA